MTARTKLTHGTVNGTVNMHGTDLLCLYCILLRLIRNVCTTTPTPCRAGRYCEKEEYPFISMEWFGVGDSEGRFEHGTISR